MKVLLEIKDDKASALLEVLKDLPFVKITILITEKDILIQEIKEAVSNLKLVRTGKLKARDARQLLSEL